MEISKHLKNDPYKPLCKWEDDFYVQWGGNGLVLKCGGLEKSLSSDNPLDEAVKQTVYRTAFFEAFSNVHDMFVRGEGDTIEIAEQNAFNKAVKQIACNDHEYERRHYRNGCGVCKHCGHFKKVFDPLEKCAVCGVATYYSERDGKWYCEEHTKNELMIKK